MSRTIVIVGGVAGGATAAAKARRVDEHCEIVVFERGPYVSFANCGLPYFIGGEIDERERLLLMTPETFWDKYRVRVHVGHEALAIDRARRVLRVCGPQGEREHPYDALILAQGAQPITPPIPGIDRDHVFTLRDVPDMDAIHRHVAQRAPRSAVVIGGGFIGLEMAEAFHRRGLAVSVVERLEHILPVLDADIAEEFGAGVERERLRVVTGRSVTRIEAGHVLLDDERRIAADLVLVSAGVRPEVEMAKAAGLEIGTTGGVVVDQHLRSSDPAIHAVGDAAETVHRVTGARTRIPLAGPANRQGRIAGANAAGAHLGYRGALGTAIVRVFDRVAGVTGLSTRQAEAAGLEVMSSMTRDASHAGYFPGAQTVVIKLIVERFAGRVVGAQVIGGEGVDKRLDVLATAITAGFDVDDLADLDLAYAPPFGSANDPINQAGFTAGHVLRGEIEVVTAPEQLPPDAQLLDVRGDDEVAAHGKLHGARVIPLPQLRDRLDELDRERPVVVYCHKGQRGYLAERILRGHGFARVANIPGGFAQARHGGWQVDRP